MLSFCYTLEQWFSAEDRYPQGGPQIILGGPQMINLMCNIVFSLNSKQTNIKFKSIECINMHISKWTI